MFLDLWIYWSILRSVKSIKWGLLDKWTPELAWWVGLVYGDGNIYRTKRDSRVTFVCNEDTALKWREMICPDAGVQVKKNCLSVYVDSTRLVDWFAEKGIVGEKSTNLEWPSYLPVELNRHFLRGLWDTDGSVKIERRKPKHGNDTLNVNFSAKNMTFAGRVQAEVSMGSNVESGKLIRSGKVMSGSECTWHSFKHTGAPAVLVCDYLYGDAPAHIRGESRYRVYRDYVDSRPSGACRCGGEVWTEAMCRTCWWTKRRADSPRKICACGRDVVAKSMCLNCYKRNKRNIFNSQKQ